MATANPEDADFTCKNPDCPKGIFKWNTILNHIARARNCKIFYSEEEVNAMKKEITSEKKDPVFKPDDEEDGNMLDMRVDI